MPENPLGYEKISTLLRGFAIPSITATLVSSLYNIVDQVFIGQGVGYLGNAATNVSYPLSTICLAISLLLGIGSASRFSICLGKQKPEQAARLVGNGIVLLAGAGILYAVMGELFLTPLLRVFGATEEVIPFARQYSQIILLGMPFLILTNGISNLIRADGSPRYSMLCMVAGAVANTILDPFFIFVLDWGIFGAALATVLGQLLSFALALRYLWHFRTVVLTRACFRLVPRDNLCTIYMGISSCINQVAITLVQIVLNNSLTYYGARSIYGEDIPLAACGIVMKTNAILLSIVVGISQGVQPIMASISTPGNTTGCGRHIYWPSSGISPFRRWDFACSSFSPPPSLPSSETVSRFTLNLRFCLCARSSLWCFSTVCSCSPPISLPPSVKHSRASCSL